MTTKEAVTLFGGAATELVGALAEAENDSAATQLQRCIDAYDMAISALLAQQQLESNDPLTVDELLEMAKEPVWTVGVSYTRDGTFSMWDIIESVNENGIHFGYSDEYVEWWNYGLKNMDGNLLGWLAYRRKPQEV